MVTGHDLLLNNKFFLCVCVCVKRFSLSPFMCVSRTRMCYTSQPTLLNIVFLLITSFRIFGSQERECLF